GGLPSPPRRGRRASDPEREGRARARHRARLGMWSAHSRTLGRVIEFVGRDGNRLASDAAGDPADPPAILLHGGGQTRHSWGTTLGALADKGWRAYAECGSPGMASLDRKSTRLNSSHVAISYAVFCLKKKKTN